MKDKKQSRLRRARRIRAKISRSGDVRLSVHRTSQHIYAQVIDATGSQVLAATSGTRIAELAKKAGVEKVVYDRSGFRFHGRVKALADAAREAGLKI